MGGKIFLVVQVSCVKLSRQPELIFFVSGAIFVVSITFYHAIVNYRKLILISFDFPIFSDLVILS